MMCKCGAEMIERSEQKKYQVVATWKECKSCKRVAKVRDITDKHVFRSKPKKSI